MICGDTHKLALETHTKPLTDTHIKRLKALEKEMKHADGGGLALLVKPNGSKLWRFRYRFDGKQKELALGKYPAVCDGASGLRVGFEDKDDDDRAKFSVFVGKSFSIFPH